jgi:hypothetical protein
MENLVAVGNPRKCLVFVATILQPKAALSGLSKTQVIDLI